MKWLESKFKVEKFRNGERKCLQNKAVIFINNPLTNGNLNLKAS